MNVLYEANIQHRFLAYFHLTSKPLSVSLIFSPIPHKQAHIYAHTLINLHRHTQCLPARGTVIIELAFIQLSKLRSLN